MNQIQTIEFEKKFDNNGYISIFTDEGWIKEHVYLVKRFLNRNLTKDEVIHHINSIRTDNRLSNLMLFPNQKEHQKFHLKLNQFKLTNPIKRQIEYNIIQVKLRELNNEN